MSIDLVALLCLIPILFGAAFTHVALRRRHPQLYGRRAMESMRIKWIDAYIAQPQHFIFVVQTLRNSIMAASLAASALAILLGSILGWGSELHRQSLQWHAQIGWRFSETPLALKLALITACVLIAIFHFLVAVRHYHQLGYLFTPFESKDPAAQVTLLRATRHYGDAMRWSAALLSIVAWIASPWLALALACFVIFKSLNISCREQTR